MKIQKSIIPVLVILAFSFCNEKSEDSHEQISENVFEKEDTVKTKIKEETERSFYQSFKFTENCNDQEKVYEDYGKYGKKKPYNVTLSNNNDTLTINYQIIDDCCLRFTGGITQRKEERLDLACNKYGSPCECNCIYLFEYILPYTEMPDTLFINKSVIKFEKINL